MLGGYFPNCLSTRPQTSVSFTCEPASIPFCDESSTPRWASLVAGRPCEPLTRCGVERDALGGEVEVQLDRVVARLAVDIDGAGELGGLGVVEPPVIGLPTVGRGDQHHFAARSWSS